MLSLLYIVFAPLAISFEDVCSGYECIDSSEEALRCNRSRFWGSIVAMASVGSFQGPEGSRGVSREALSDADIEARKLLDSWAFELSLRREVDEVGNSYYRRLGRKTGANVVAIGSHLDSQPGGGRFDGSYGVLAGLEVLRILEQSGIETDLDIELVNWSNEEGSRFSPPMMGSGVATGQLPLDAVMATPARENPSITFGSELQRHGLIGAFSADVKSRSWKSYFEVHIEQGPTLDQTGYPLGLVIGGQGQRTFSVHVTGFEGHSGTVPMLERQDALVCASSMVLEIRNAGLEHGVLTTVGSLSVSPGSFNTIPGSVEFSLDMRSPNITALDAAEGRLRHALPSLARQGNCAVQRFTRSKARGIVEFDTTLLGHLREASISVGVDLLSMWSGAGHDACYVAERIPAAMLFVACKDGISHNPRENATLSDLALGIDVLLAAVLRVAIDKQA